MRRTFIGIAAAAIALALSVVAPVRAQTVHRTNVAAGEATPTGASFSIVLPVPYSDVELKADDPPNPPAVVRSVTGITDDGVRLTASEMPFLPGASPKPIADFMDALVRKSGADPSDVRHTDAAGMETLSFTLIDSRGGGNFFRVIRTGTAEYILLIQFHRDGRDKAAGMRDAFFDSFRLAGHEPK